MSGQFVLWPPIASAHAGEVDALVLAFSTLIILLSAPVFILIVVFAFKYRRGRRADRAHPVDRNVWLETSWSTIPFALMFSFICLDWRHIPANLLSIGAIDFGILVDGAVVMVENIFRQIVARKGTPLSVREIIREAAAEVEPTAEVDPSPEAEPSRPR